MSVIAYVKEHPYRIAGGVFVLGILYLLIRPKKSVSNVSVLDPISAQTAGGNALQAASLQAAAQNFSTQTAGQVQMTQISAALDALKDRDAASLSALTVQSDTAKTIAGLQASVYGLTSNLSAQVAQGANDNQTKVQLAQIASNTTVATTPINAQLDIAHTVLSSNYNNNELASLTPNQQLATIWARNNGFLGPNQVATGGLLNSKLAGNPTAQAQFNNYAMAAGFYGKAS